MKKRTVFIGPVIAGCLFVSAIIVWMGFRHGTGKDVAGVIQPKSIEAAGHHILWDGPDATNLCYLHPLGANRLVAAPPWFDTSWPDMVFLVDRKRESSDMPVMFGGRGQGPGAIRGHVSGVSVSDGTLFVRDRNGMEAYTASGVFTARFEPLPGIPKWFHVVDGKVYEISPNVLTAAAPGNQHLIRVYEITAENILHPLRKVVDGKTLARWREQVGLPPMNMEPGQPAKVYFGSFLDTAAGPVCCMCTNADGSGLLINVRTGRIRSFVIPGGEKDGHGMIIGAFTGIDSFFVAVRVDGPQATPFRYRYRLVRLSSAGRVMAILTPDFRKSLPAGAIGASVQPFGPDPGCELEPGEIVVSEVVVTMGNTGPSPQPRLIAYRFPASKGGGA